MFPFLLNYWEKDPLLCLMGSLLLLAISCLWIHRYVAFVLALSSAGLAYYMGRISPFAIGILGLFSTLLLLEQHINRASVLKGLITVAIAAVATASFFHLLPGFTNWQILPPTQVSSGAPPYDFYLNLDKGLVGFLLLFFMIKPAQNRHEWTMILKGWLALTPWGILCLLGITYFFGWTVYEPKKPTFFLAWAAINLLTVSLVEEALYRGFIQERLSRWIGPWNALILNTLAFMGGHFYFTHDWRYLSLVGLASFFYGLTYHLTKRVEAAALVHFSVNAFHLLLWTYPRLLTP